MKISLIPINKIILTCWSEWNIYILKLNAIWDLCTKLCDPACHRRISGGPFISIANVGYNIKMAGLLCRVWYKQGVWFACCYQTNERGGSSMGVQLQFLKSTETVVTNLSHHTRLGRWIVNYLIILSQFQHLLSVEWCGMNFEGKGRKLPRRVSR
jgi:hypothetical protein